MFIYDSATHKQVRDVSLQLRCGDGSNRVVVRLSSRPTIRNRQTQPKDVAQFLRHVRKPTSNPQIGSRASARKSPALRRGFNMLVSWSTFETALRAIRRSAQLVICG
jgi:hypothetical protein